MVGFAVGGVAGGAATSGADAPDAPVCSVTEWTTYSDGYSSRAIAATIGADAFYGLARPATGQGVDVAVVDTGVNDVAGTNLVQGPDFSGTGSAAAAADTFGHGTHMASIIASRSAVYPGIAPDARIVSLKVGGYDGRADDDQVIAALDWATAHHSVDGFNIRVVNLAYGSPSDSGALSAAVQRAWDAGIVVVTAAGNDGGAITAPGSNPNVITVGAVETQGTLATADDSVPDYSAGGTDRAPDVVAPGQHVPGVRTPGSFVDKGVHDHLVRVAREHDVAIATLGPDDDVYDWATNEVIPALRAACVDEPSPYLSRTHVKGTGTSEATAVVSGAVALMLSANPALTPAQVKAVLTESAVPVAGDATRVGAGEIDLSGAQDAAPVVGASSVSTSAPTSQSAVASDPGWRGNY
ncbi:MAG: S8 family serine peptidase, partial [Actinomycetota bacterium]|nr:S8 family serine peptidase [Actinomycetota bacterium]